MQQYCVLIFPQIFLIFKITFFSGRYFFLRVVVVSLRVENLNVFWLLDPKHISCSTKLVR